ncbi:hypothetical protein EBR96_08845 [bacterium]|nr:hypothetical protein [bacterium]
MFTLTGRIGPRFNEKSWGNSNKSIDFVLHYETQKHDGTTYQENAVLTATNKTFEILGQLAPGTLVECKFSPRGREGANQFAGKFFATNDCYYIKRL